MKIKSALCLMALPIVLASCRTDEAANAQLNQEQTAQPSPPPTSGDPVADTSASETTTTSPTSIDYDNGTSYPAAATTNLQSFDVPAGASTIHVPVTLDKPSANTVIAYVRVYDGDGGRASPDTTKPVFFRPGDPLTKTVAFDVRYMNEGNNVKITQRHVPDGAKRGQANALATARAGAVNMPVAEGRDSLRFAPHGTLIYAATGSDIKITDAGSADSFSTALHHGRTQTGNAETGYYAPLDWGGFQRTDEGLKLITEKLPEPFIDPATSWTTYHRAANLSAHKMKSTWFKYGTIEIEAKMPNRDGSWPALWLVVAGGWPPEIDLYEGFNYNGEWKPDRHLSTNLHGGKNNTRTFTRPMQRLSMSDLGLPNTIDSDFHKFQAVVTPEWITLFVDGVETMQYANPFAGTTWYPIINVGVKGDPKGAYTDGSGTMVLKSVKIWKAE